VLTLGSCESVAGLLFVQRSMGQKDTSEEQCRQAHDPVPVQPGARGQCLHHCASW